MIIIFKDRTSLADNSFGLNDFSKIIRVHFFFHMFGLAFDTVKIPANISNIVNWLTS